MNSLKMLTFVSLACMVSLHAAVDTGSMAPSFNVADSTGIERSLADFKGKYVVLEWTNHGCPFVSKYYQKGHMQALQKAMTEDDVVWLQVLSSAPGKQGYLTADEAEAMRAKQQVHSTALLLDADGKLGRLYGARTTPHMFLINPEGLVIYQGAIDSIRSARSSDIDKATNYVKAAYESAVAGEPVKRATTPPYGCGVKY